MIPAALLAFLLERPPAPRVAFAAGSPAYSAWVYNQNPPNGNEFTMDDLARALSTPGPGMGHAGHHHARGGGHHRQTGHRPARRRAPPPLRGVERW
jgi:hypothetical protein